MIRLKCFIILWIKGGSGLLFLLTIMTGVFVLSDSEMVTYCNRILQVHSCSKLWIPGIKITNGDWWKPLIIEKKRYAKILIPHKKSVDKNIYQEIYKDILKIFSRCLLLTQHNKQLAKLLEHSSNLSHFTDFWAKISVTKTSLRNQLTNDSLNASLHTRIIGLSIALHMERVKNCAHHWYNTKDRRRRQNKASARRKKNGNQIH